MVESFGWGILSGAIVGGLVAMFGGDRVHAIYAASFVGALVAVLSRTGL